MRASRVPGWASLLAALCVTGLAGVVMALREEDRNELRLACESAVEAWGAAAGAEVMPGLGLTHVTIDGVAHSLTLSNESKQLEGTSWTSPRYTLSAPFPPPGGNSTTTIQLAGALTVTPAIHRGLIFGPRPNETTAMFLRAVYVYVNTTRPPHGDGGPVLITSPAVSFGYGGAAGALRITVLHAADPTVLLRDAAARRMVEESARSSADMYYRRLTVLAVCGFGVAVALFIAGLGVLNMIPNRRPEPPEAGVAGGKGEAGSEASSGRGGWEDGNGGCHIEMSSVGPSTAATDAADSGGEEEGEDAASSTNRPRELAGTGKPARRPSLADDDLQSCASAGDMAAEPSEPSSSPLRQGGRALSFDSISVAVAGAE
ncbi:hypothetical protein DIPPA_30088 [Diplonema papillatum]|nr:hypothetical protein DIPPA_30088 [Diplonema papillatum]